ncbi:MAG: DNA repair ATPase [Opitutaceae bacterium]|nr:DNA repair ATPase [Opitutaceae bacterium]
MAEPIVPASPTPVAAATALGSATYEIIRQRLQANGAALRERMGRLDARRQEVFGTIEFKLLQSDRITTAHNCMPRDMVQLGQGRFLFGFNVLFGLKKEIELADVFAAYQRDAAEGSFKETDLTSLDDKVFLTDFKRLYQVYAKAAFSKFSLIGAHLYFVFQVGAGGNDIAVFKWAFNGGQLRYVDGRAEAEFRREGFPPQFEFRWQTPPRESFRYGSHSHVSIEDRIFVDCIGGDLTLKVEDNTATGEGIYAEPVEDRNQKVDDADISYTTPLPHVIVLKVRPYKETAARYYMFNEKQQTAVRVDSIGQSCALLPEDHGLIFPDGYYLATGDLKRFDSRERDLVLERIVHAPNGEDSLYVFYNRSTGEYVLLPYRLIAQKIEERITCHGFSLFADGYLVLFRNGDEAQKHHTIQLRQTPFHQPGYEPPGQRDAFLYQVGNKDVVRCLAECNEVLTLVGRESPYAELYSDLVKRCGAILDAYPWLKSDEGFQLDDALRQLAAAADKAVEEFDKVRRLQREAAQRVRDARARCEERFNLVRRASFRTLPDFVQNLAALRQLRGELITLKEVRYVDLAAIGETETSVAAQSAELAKRCVSFLLQPAALEPYRVRATEYQVAAEKVAKGAEGRKIAEAVAAEGGELELLIEIVNSLRIDDATEATRIIDCITAIYATLNQVKAALKNRLQSLAAAEGTAQFAAQMKLLGQAVASYLDLCQTPAKCDEYLNRLSVQIEELEGTFADYEDFTVQLAEKRTAVFEAFEQRKVTLVEQRNRKTAALLTAAERVLKSIQNRLAALKSVDEINALMAADLMVGKVRDLIAQLLDLGDSVKADDLQGRLKSLQQEAVRQLRDKQELFVGGSEVIQLGKHRFNFNTQPLELAVVNRDGVPHLHLTSTKYFAPITDEAFLAARDVWDQELVSENAQVYRAEYLAARLLAAVEARGETAAIAARSAEERLALVRDFAASRYDEGYTKGVHDLDGARIFDALVVTHELLQLARYEPTARACAVVFWHRFCPAETRRLWTAKLKGLGERNRLFPGDAGQHDYITALRALLAAFIADTRLYPAEISTAAGEYLFHELSGGDAFVVSREANEAVAAFQQQLISNGGAAALAGTRASLAAHPGGELDSVRDFVRGFVRGRPEAAHYVEEIAALVFCGGDFSPRVVSAKTTQTLEGMKGAHAVVREGRYVFDYAAFRQKLAHYDASVAPRFTQLQQCKRALLERERTQLRLEEFKPRVLTSFVRNQLIDQIYLPLVGDNLAKQIGAAGAAKRTDLMGLLLLISPPGYGKTTLLEYVASRLGIVFVKINGPALGADVTSLDPAGAPNAAAREELQRLNLALEMGDNVMLCIDDIQHCSAEFLQKFISLCDGQRKIEGVWRGQARTHDLRGRKVVVVMAGNPYTESGQKFRIPDMLANRADTYNLGDIIGGSRESFEASYLENAVTSNAVLAPLTQRSQRDIRAFIRVAEGGAAESFEGSYSAQEADEIVAVMKKLIAIGDVILKVKPRVHPLGRAGGRVSHGAAVSAPGLVSQHEPARGKDRTADERRRGAGVDRRPLPRRVADPHDGCGGELPQVQGTDRGADARGGGPLGGD